jgi:lipopolysaccharide biosynthesis regulator YciM
MQRDKKERQQAEKIATTDERLLAAQDELELSREQIEFWRELVDSLNLELRDKEQRIQQVEQELMHTNQELCDAFMLQKLEPDEAIEFAQKVLQNQKSVSEALAELLTAIYNRAIKPKELEQMGSSPTESLINAEVNQMVADLEEFKACLEQLLAQNNELGSRGASRMCKIIRLLKHR